MKKYIFITLALYAVIAIGGISAYAQEIPEILEIGDEELVSGSPYERCSIATDSKNQPHIVVGAFQEKLGLLDKVNGQWQEYTFNIKQYNSQTKHVFNPTIGIDTTTDTAWIGAVMYTPDVESACGLAVIIRESVSTSPGSIGFSRNDISPLDWDPGILRLDPTRPGYAVGYSYNGYWEEYQYDSGSSSLKKQTRAGVLFSGYGGEKNSFAISEGGVWHAAAGGYSAWSSSYQNSTRASQGGDPVTFAAYSSYPKQGNDTVYIGVGTDNENSEAAYLACDFGGSQGICVNIWNGTHMLFSPNALPSLGGDSTSGASRFAPQWASAKNGGAFLCWQKNGRIKLRYVNLNLEVGPEIDISAGTRPSICTDRSGNLHIVYSNYGIRYRKLKVSGSGADGVTFACDFDGDGLDDIAAYDNGIWHIRGTDDGGFNGYRGNYFTYALGTSSDLPVPADYDGDGKADPAVYEPSNVNGSWWIYLTGSSQLVQQIGFGGGVNDLPVPADYDGDGKADRCVWDANGTWHVAQSGGGYTGTTLGVPANGDIPVPGDYDGDGAMDIAVFEPDGVWHISGSSSGYMGLAYGQTGDIPIPQDYNGDGTWEIAVYRPETHAWLINGVQDFGFGADGDLPVPGRFYESNKTYAAVYRPSESLWILWMTAAPKFGGGDDLYPIPAKWDNDAMADMALFRNSDASWHVRGTTDGNYGVNYGLPGDWGVPADYDGDGIEDKALWRDGVWYIDGSVSGTMSYAFGQIGDTPVPADYDGDGRADPAVYEASGVWHIHGTTAGYSGYVLGGAQGDQPVPMDVDSDGLADPAIYDANSTWHAIKSSDHRYWGMQWGNPGMIPVIGSFAGGENKAIYDPTSRTFYIYPGVEQYQMPVGSSEMTPVCQDYDGDGIDDFATYRSDNGEWIIRHSSDGSFVLSVDSVGVSWGTPSSIAIGVRYY